MITAAFVFGIMLYTTVVIPGIRTVAAPIEEDTREDQVEALRVLAAGNTLIIICLGLVLALQVSVLLPDSNRERTYGIVPGWTRMGEKDRC